MVPTTWGVWGGLLHVLTAQDDAFTTHLRDRVDFFVIGVARAGELNGRLVIDWLDSLRRFCQFCDRSYSWGLLQWEIWVQCTWNPLPWVLRDGCVVLHVVVGYLPYSRHLMDCIGSYKVVIVTSDLLYVCMLYITACTHSSSNFPPWQ